MNDVVALIIDSEETLCASLLTAAAAASKRAQCDMQRSITASCTESNAQLTMGLRGHVTVSWDNLGVTTLANICLMRAVKTSKHVQNFRIVFLLMFIVCLLPYVWGAPTLICLECGFAMYQVQPMDYHLAIHETHHKQVRDRSTPAMRLCLQQHTCNCITRLNK